MFCHGEEQSDSSSNFAPFVYNSVNVITGEYCEAQTDLTVDGLQTLQFRRQYNSSDSNGHWKFNFPNLFYTDIKLPLDGRLFKPLLAYEYDKNKRLSLIKVLNKQGNKTLHSIKLAYPDGLSSTCNIETDDGKFLRYRFDDVDQTLIEVAGSDCKECRYHYTTHPVTKQTLLTKREESDGRYLYTEYYDLGPNDVGGTSVEIIDPKKDPNLGKVKLQRAPLGHDDTPIIMNRFFYHSYYTEVYDALSHKTIYRYLPGHQCLTAIEHYDANKLYRVEHLFWSTESGVPRLVSRAFADGQGNILICRTFTYNTQGCITKETLFGNLTGKNLAPLHLNKQGKPEGKSEHYSIYYKYSEEAPYLLLSQSEDNGLTTSYSYYPKTNLLKAKLITDSNSIRIRYFYFYDDNDRVIKTIIDDGKSVNSEDINSVTERHITEHIWQENAVRVIEERYLDLVTGQEKLLKLLRENYSPQGKLISQDFYDNNNSYCYTIRYAYDPSGHLTSTIHNQGNSTEFTYDANGNKVSETVFGKNGTSNDLLYTYDYSNRLIRCDETGSDGQNLTKIHCYDYAGNKVDALDIFGNTIHYDYDALGRVIKTTFPSILNVNDTEIQPVEIREYDIFNRMTTLIDTNGYVTQSRYNARGKPVEIRYPDGTTETYEYTLDGSLLHSKARDGVRTDYKTDFLARVVQADQFDVNGTLLGIISTTYSAFRTISTEDKNGNICTYKYDGAGRCIEKIQHTPNDETRTEYTYDAYGKQCRQKEWHGSECIVYVTEHDCHGNILQTRLEDAAGNILKCENQNVSEKKSFPILYKYDYFNVRGQNVLQTSITDASGVSTITTFDALKRIEKVEKKNCFGQIISQQDLRHDPMGNKIRETHTIFGSNSLYQSFSIQWRYGPGNRIEEIREAAGTSQQSITTTIYNALGKIEQFVKPDGVSLHYQYDASNRVSAYFASDNSFYYQYEYDANNNLTVVTDMISQTVTRRHYNDSGKLLSEILGNELSVTMEYNEDGRRKHLILPDNSAIGYEYNEGLLKSIDRYDKKGQHQYSYSYQKLHSTGRVESAQMISGLGEISYRYDDRDRLIAIQTPYWSETIPLEGYNASDNITCLTIEDPAGSFSPKYNYDDNQQLISESEELINYDYDSVNNRISQNDLPYTIDRRNQLIQAGDISYKYDASGCLIEKFSKIEKEKTIYEYDALNRLTKVIQGMCTIQYSYDVFGRRLSKTIVQNNTDSKQTIRFIYDGECEIGAVDEQGKIVELRILGIGKGAEIGAAIALELNDRVYAPIHDHRGSVCLLVDGVTRESAEFNRYSAFGEIQIFNESGVQIEESVINNPWQFSSKRYDKESDLFYFGKRYYDPSIGRWITPDPLGFVDGPNRYAYLLNNPMSMQDMYGLFSFSSLWNSFSDAVSSAFGKVMSVLQSIRDFFDQFSYCKHMEADIENIGLQLFGKTYLAMSGYYIDNLEKGVYGEGEFGNHIRVTAINGILNLRADCVESVSALSRTHGDINIHYIFYPTEGWFWDMVNAFLAKGGYATPAAKLLAQTWKQMIEEMGGTDAGGVIVHYAHSIGGTNTQIARGLLTPEEQKMIRVFTVGSATMLPNEGFASVSNFISTHDAIGFIASPINYIQSFFNPDSNIFHIKSATWIPLIDHLMLMETYQRLIEMLGKRFVDDFHVG